MTVALLGVLFGLTTVGLRGSIQKEGPRGLAHSLAGELRAARAEAQRSGQLVGVCFPSERKTNSLSRSVYIRRGAQRGKVWKRLNFEREFVATIFLGTWPSAVLSSDSLPPGWSSSTSDEVAIVFRPDGTAVCNDIPMINDSVPIVVAQALQGNFSGPSGSLSGALNPQTVWVSKSGTVRVNADQAPIINLSKVGTSELPIAQLKADVVASSTPRITAANLFPKMIDPDQGSGIGQTLVQLHPYQKQGSQIEYGLASIEVSAVDDDGGPLSYELISEVSGGSGGPGAFSVPNQEGVMKYALDPKSGQHRWRALVSWRPPPGAPAGTVYNLKFIVRDPEGNTAEASAATNLLPPIESLIPSRIVMETTSRKLFLTNLDGAGQVWVNPKEGEYFPFFGRDGSKLYSFFDRPGNRAELRSRPANGTTVFDSLAVLDGGPSNAWIDPSNQFAMVAGAASVENFPWADEHAESSGGGGMDDTGGGGTTYRLDAGTSRPATQDLFIVNLATGDTLDVPKIKPSSFFWASGRPGVFGYTSFAALAPVPTVQHGPQIPSPGYQDRGRLRQLVGNPMTAIDASGGASSAENMRYNPANQDWYAVYSGGQLSIHRHSTGQTVLVSAGPIEFVDKGSQRPAWSANGEHLSFVQNPGSGAVVKSYRVLDASGNALVPPQRTFEKAVPDASRAQVDPNGKWVYYLENGEVTRSLNTNPSTRTVKISKHIEPIRDYAISP